MKKHTYEDIKTEASKYEYRSDFKKHSYKYYKAASSRKILDDVCSHMKQKLNSWNYESIHKVALKCSTKSEFRKQYKVASDAADRLGIFEKVTAHMISKYNYMTDEEIHTEALKYEFRSDFRYANYNVYAMASKRGLLKKVCSHMQTKEKACSRDVIYIWRVVGTNKYKIGITSARLGIRRIEEVSKFSGLDYEIIIMKKDNMAEALEKDILEIGSRCEYSGFNGYSEFRVLTDAELTSALRIIDKGVAK